MTNNSPFFSVVIPLFNKEKYISRSIMSVLLQTYRNFELIVINDGSTDNSLNILKSITDSRIKVISTENRGVSAARNLGIQNSIGKVVSFLDADDQWLPEYLQEIINLESRFPEAKAYATAVYQNNGKRSTYKHVDRNYPKHWLGLLDTLDIFFNGIPFNSSSISVDRSIFQQIEGFDENMKYGEDINMWMRISLVTPIAFSRKYLAEVFTNTQNRSGYEHFELSRMYLIEKSLNETRTNERCISKYSQENINLVTKSIDSIKFIDTFLAIGKQNPKQLRGKTFLSSTKPSIFINKLIRNSLLSVTEKSVFLARMSYWIIDYLIRGKKEM